MGKQRTSVFIDGFNLYHGALRHTPYKWLNPLALARLLIDEDKEITKIKYFTAKVIPRQNDPGQPFRQNLYLRAVSTLNAQIIYGRCDKEDLQATVWRSSFSSFFGPQSAKRFRPAFAARLQMLVGINPAVIGTRTAVKEPPRSDPKGVFRLCLWGFI